MSLLWLGDLDLDRDLLLDLESRELGDLLLLLLFLSSLTLRDLDLLLEFDLETDLLLDLDLLGDCLKIY